MNRWLAVMVLLPLSAAAQDAFEIQVYNAETAPPLQVGSRAAPQSLRRGFAGE